MKNNLEEILLSVIQLGAHNTTQIEALTEAIESIFVECGICAKGELKKRTQLIADQTQAHFEQKAANNLKKTQHKKKYPDLSSLPNESFGEKQ